MNGDENLIRAAAQGDLAALRQLAARAVDQALRVEPDRVFEALTAAELWGRFALAIGDSSDLARLAEILEIRVAADERAERNARAEEYAHDLGVIAAGGGDVFWREFNREVRRALNGDEDAIRQMFDTSLQSIQGRRCDVSEGLVCMELIARIGVAWNLSRFHAVLAGVLCFIVDNDERRDRMADAAERKRELLDRLSMMAASGDDALVAASRLALPKLPECIGVAAIKEAALRHPDLLEILPNEGNC